MEYAPSGMAQIDPASHCLHVNPAMCRMLGYSSDELLQHDLTSFLHPEDQPKYQQAIRQLMSGEQEGHFLEVRCLHRDGTLKWAMMGIAPVFDDEKQLMHFVTQLMDVTTQKKQQREIMELNSSLEAKVKQRTAQLEEANRELESFSYSVSHDLKGPVKNIEGLTAALHDLYADQLDEQGVQLVGHINASAQRMNRLISGYLNFTKISQQQIEKMSFNIQEQFEEAFREISPQYAEKSIDFKVDDLPQAFGDPDLIRQVVHNLTSNALKYSALKAEIRVRVMGSEKDEMTVYQITDNGVGFDPQSADKLFRMFQRLHDAKDFEGHGIGLAFSYRIIKKHGGQMWAESESGQGATFSFSLPTT
jgi:PAS domain S-box-containing protein